MPALESDVVIIGSGLTGAAAALALVSQNASVTMIESGTNMPGGLVLQADRNLLRRTRPPASPEQYTASIDSRTLWYHELSPGGLSNQWTCAVPRYAPSDFNEGARLHEKYRWAVTYDDLAPYYERMEKVIGVTGPAEPVSALPIASTRRRSRLPAAWQGVARAAAGKGRALLPMPMATGRGWGVKSGGTPFNSYSDVIVGLQQSGRLQVQLGAHALRLEHDAAGQVERVIYFDPNTNGETSIACQAAVVAAGPIASTKLLLNSVSSLFPSGLGNHNGLLGSYLHDHVHDMCVFELNRPLPRLGLEAYFTRAPYADSAPLLVAGCVVGGRISPLDRLLTLTPVPTRAFGSIVFGTMVPLESNCVRPAEVKDAHGLPQVDIRLQYSEDDKATTRKAREDLLGVFSEAGFDPKMRWSTDDPVPGSSVHFGGTVRMHESPEYGLTDGWGRLHSVKNVVVADASVFTTCVEKNPTLTAMALANRAAERLALDLKAGNLGTVRA